MVRSTYYIYTYISYDRTLVPIAPHPTIIIRRNVMPTGLKMSFIMWDNKMNHAARYYIGQVQLTGRNL